MLIVYVRICLSVYLFVCLCLSGLIQLIIIKHIKVVSSDGLLAFLAAFRKNTCYFHYFMYLSIILFVENKFFFFFFFFLYRRIRAIEYRGLGLGMRQIWE